MGSLHQARDVHHIKECWDLAAKQGGQNNQDFDRNSLEMFAASSVWKSMKSTQNNSSKDLKKKKRVSFKCILMFLLLPDCRDFVNSSKISGGGGGGGKKATKTLIKVYLKKSWNKPKSVANSWHSSDRIIITLSTEPETIRQPCLICCLLVCLFVFGRDKVKERQTALLWFVAKKNKKTKQQPRCWGENMHWNVVSFVSDVLICQLKIDMLRVICPYSRAKLNSKLL